MTSVFSMTTDRQTIHVDLSYIDFQQYRYDDGVSFCAPVTADDPAELKNAGARHPNRLTSLRP